MSTVHVGVVLYNSRQDLPACLSALLAQTYPHLSIVALDNHSPDDSAAWLRAHYPHLTVIANPRNDGFARAHNHLLRRCALSADDYYLPLNPDVVLTPEYVTCLVQCLQSTGAGWATGRLRLAGSDGLLYSVGHGLRRDGYAVNIGYGLPDDSRFSQSREVFGAPGAAPLISAALIAALAPDGELFDTTMFMYGEDTDLDWRARRQGWRCWYAADAVAVHRGSQPDEALRVHALANRYLSVLKNAYPADLMLYNLPLIVLHCLARLVFSPRQGAALIARLVRNAPAVWRRRTPPRLSRADMHRWFQWSAAQPTAQPVSPLARLRAYLIHRR